MKLKLNRTLLSQVNWDSAAISPLASVVHRFSVPGQYKLMILAGEKLDRIGVIDLLMDEKAPNEQLNINLEAVAKEKFSKSNQIAHFGNTNKPVVFYASGGTQKYVVLAYQYDREKEAKVFDSRQLQAGDTFIVNPIISGNYSFSSSQGGKGEIMINKKSGRSLPTQGSVVECTEDGFKPDKVKSDFLQPIFFQIKTKKPLRITMKFEKRLDGGVIRKVKKTKKQKAKKK
ncbi:hypothetical protein OKW21_001924 [Catalinimonas alkaloidigena]|uniref:hypothetical protein n=1 Tax=Catalinimonas alkaloidigena TaxID=1075417 RepID=UPI0024068D07|nr:hypothetical protein [Catalinimonas alkaloidigena]MDF9796661.1 hypothetical protein [Catalinimonas alkaloidigena]